MPHLTPHTLMHHLLRGCAFQGIIFGVLLVLSKGWTVTQPALSFFEWKSVAGKANVCDA
jgi:hypothetical protein